jgi:hypothetical protein
MNYKSFTRDYGGRADGNDIATAFGLALDWLVANGGLLKIPTGTYTLSTVVSKTFSSEVEAIIECESGVTIDCSAMTTGTGLTLQGAIVTADIALSASPSKGDLTIQTASSIAAGTVIQISTATYIAANPATGFGRWQARHGDNANAYFKGEINRVLAVSGAGPYTLVLQYPLRSDYNLLYATVNTLRMPSLKMYGGTWLFNDDLTAGLHLKYLQSSEIDGVNLYGRTTPGVSDVAVERGLVLDTVKDFKVKAEMFDVYSDQNDTNNVGHHIELRSTEHVTLDGCRLENGVRPVQFGSYHPDRYTHITNSRIVPNMNKGQAPAIKTFWQTEGMRITDNPQLYHLVLAGDDVVVSGNRVEGSDNWGIEITPADGGGTVRIIDNEVIGNRANAFPATPDSKYGIVVKGDHSGQALETILMKGNTIRHWQYGYCLFHDTIFSGSPTCKRWIIADCTADDVGHAFFSSGASTAVPGLGTLGWKLPTPRHRLVMTRPAAAKRKSWETSKSRGAA